MSDELLKGSGKLFFDTNVIVYALDKADRRKRDRCRALLRAAAVSGRGVISTQVLHELFVVTTRTLGIDPLDAKAVVAAQENFEVVVMTPALIREAIDCSVLARLSFWDALVAVAAESAACAFLVTEDLNDGQLIRGVKVRSPFV
jgi:predicted nucleic acid-binding protein